jgi:hypothetical protein
LTSPTTTSRRAWAIWVSACAALVAVIVVSLVLGIHDYRGVQSNDRADKSSGQAVDAAKEFALRMDNFAAPSAATYESQIEGMLTTKGKADLDQVKSVMAQVYAAAQPAKSGQKAPSGHIVYAGVSDIDSDSATVLVAHDTSVTGSTKQLHFRWTVTLKKIGGTWLVDGLPPEVTGGTSQ